MAMIIGSVALRSCGDKTSGGKNVDEEQTLGGKIMLCSCCCVCFLIFMGLSSLIGYLTHPYFIPLFRKTRKNGSADYLIAARSSYDKSILNLHESCKEKYGPCSVFKEKYVDDCREVVCDTVTLVMDLIQKDKVHLLHDFRQTIRASFRPTNRDESQKVSVLDGTPCTYRTDNESSIRRVGSCREGVCGPAKDRAFLRYYTRPPIHGNWTNYEIYSEKDSCLKLPKDIDMSSVAKLCTPNGSCSPYQYVFRSCSNPHPLFDGRYCWSADDSIPSPVTLALCPHCPEHTKNVADWPIDCGLAKIMYKDRCAMTHHGSLRKSKGRIFHTDFKTCCPEEARKGEHRGRCLFGNCWIATKIV
uniref:Uncharacterized protein n=1 Tax=Romanomermis culicivorax TaxID=13658 RepID=A0A915IQZ1_ROMCU